MDVDASIARLVNPSPNSGLGAVLLCKVHADRLTVPSGWQVDDQRADDSGGLAGLFGGESTVDELPMPDGRLLRRAFGNGLPE